MKKIIIAMVIISLTACVGKKKEVQVEENYQQRETNNLEQTKIDGDKAEKQEMTYELKERDVPKLGIEQISENLGGIRIVLPHKFNDMVRVINRLEKKITELEKGTANLEKMQWEINTITQKNGFEDLADFINVFNEFAQAYATYEKIRQFDMMIGNNYDPELIEAFKKKIVSRLEDQQLNKEDILYMNKNTEKFKKMIDVVDELAKKSMAKDV